jgi:hypothetical protein
MDLSDEFVVPAYDGGSIANVPGTVAALLGARFDGLPPLEPTVWEPLGGDVRRVVTLVIDALGWNLVEKERATLEPLLASATAVATLTSIFPSTTVAAMSSLWTGVAPIQHGLVGLRLLMPEYGGVGQFLDFAPTMGMGPSGLMAAGLDPQRFLQWPGLAQQLAAAGIESHAFRAAEITETMLSHMHSRGVKAEHGATSFADMLAQVCKLLEENTDKSLYLSTYWGSIDTYSHIYGWTDDNVASELSMLVTQLQTELLDALSPAARRGTVLLIVADHGQIIAPAEEQRYFEDYPQLQEMLRMPPTGEPRAAYLYARPGAREELVAGLNDQLGEAVIAMTAEEGLASGLFGPGPYSPAGVERLGDVLAITRGGYGLYDNRELDKPSADFLIGRHGSLTAAEMQVPLMAFRLG